MHLLLLEPQSGRFELLQLEVDPTKAKVEDILSQVAVTATEDPLRVQQYAGICCVDGTDIDPDDVLQNYIHEENELGIAVPEGLTGPEVTALASPILHDPNIRSMFKTVLDNKPEPSLPLDINIVTHEHFPKDDLTALTATPNSRAIPNNDRSMRKETSNVTDDENDDDDVVVAASDESESPPSPPPPPPEFKDATIGTTNTTTKDKPKSSTDNHVEKEDKAGSSSGSTGGGGYGMANLILFLSVTSALLTLLHQSMITPLSRGQRMEVGQWKSKCGLLALIPEQYTNCHDVVLELTDEGVLTLSDRGSFWISGSRYFDHNTPDEEKKDNDDVLWKVIPTPTSSGGNFLHHMNHPGESTKKSDDNTDGVGGGSSSSSRKAFEITEDGFLLLQGKNAKVKVKPYVELTPWPFTRDVVEDVPKKMRQLLMKRSK